nr:MAG TPA: hypothetical protein [Caudoviricetes sp.]
MWSTHCFSSGSKYSLFKEQRTLNPNEWKVLNIRPSPSGSGSYF